MRGSPGSMMRITTLGVFKSVPMRCRLARGLPSIASGSGIDPTPPRDGTDLVETMRNNIDVALSVPVV